MTVAKRVLGLAKSYGRRGLATLSAQIVESLAFATDRILGASITVDSGMCDVETPRIIHS